LFATTEAEISKEKRGKMGKKNLTLFTPNEPPVPDWCNCILFTHTHNGIE
jgi:hypothetical protein